VIGAGQSVNLFPTNTYETFETSDYHALTSDVVMVLGDINQAWASNWTRIVEAVSSEMHETAADASDVRPRGTDARTRRGVGTTEHAGNR
jgi:hypothetical protein